MKIEFDIHSFPCDVGKYNVTAFTDGDISFRFNGNIFLHVESCLLVEFAIVVKKWLAAVDGQRAIDFYYASMDEEEEPIFALEYDHSRGLYRPKSCWAIGESNYFVSFRDAVECAKNYISDLTLRVFDDYNVDISYIIDSSVGGRQ